MASLVFLLLLCLIVLAVQLSRMRGNFREIQVRVDLIERENSRRDRVEASLREASAPAPIPFPITPSLTQGQAPAPTRRFDLDMPPVLRPVVRPAPQPAQPPPLIEVRQAHMPVEPPPSPRGEPSPARSSAPEPERTPVWIAPEPAPGFRWESFLGVKLFAWIGGLALFLGVAFFIKYAFDQDLIRPPLRVAMGYLIGGGLLAGGLWLPRARHLVMVQTLCATGIVVLYANTFAAHALYKSYPTEVTFALMSVITAAAFLLAVRLDAQVVAVLGVLGGFLTPPLLSEGVDRALGLFGYLALLDAGLAAIAVRKRWTHLLTLGALATAVTQWGWIWKFFAPSKLTTAMTIYLVFGGLFAGALAMARRRGCVDGWVSVACRLPAIMAMGFALRIVIAPTPEGGWPMGQVFSYVALVDLLLLGMALWQWWNGLALFAALATALVQFGWITRYVTAGNVEGAMAMYLAFAALFTVALAAGQRWGRADGWLAAAAVVPPAMALGLVFVFLTKPLYGMAGRLWLLFGFVFLVDLFFLVLAWLREQLRGAHLLAGIAVFGLIALWTATYLTPSLLTPALVVFLIFALLHSAAPLVLERLKPSSMPLGWAHLFPALGLGLVLMPLSRFAESSSAVWPVVMLIDLAAIVLAVMTASLLAILSVFVLTVIAAALWIAQLPPSVDQVSGMLVVIGGFAAFFMASAALAGRKVFGRAERRGESGTGVDLTPAMFAQIVSVAAVLPFLLLTLVITRLPLAAPGAVFAVAAGLVVLLLGLSRWGAREGLPTVAFGSVWVVQFAWFVQRLTPANAAVGVAWHLGFAMLFLVFPFLLRERFAKATLPWVMSALALPLHFYMVYRSVQFALPDMMYPGLIPAGMAVPCLLALLQVVRPWPPQEPEALSRVALFGGAALLLLTLIFPIQFERQWLTVAWALEGLALLALYLRVPHAGLRAVGVALLVNSFVRLALNPWVLGVGYARTGTPLWNWYLYAYGIVSACLLAGGCLLAPPRHRMGGFPVRPLVFSLGVVLAFALLNIEIADFFSPRGGPLVFHFSAGFDQDMTYSLAWGLFAFVILTIGVKVDNAATRYAALALLIATMLKLFLHDLWQLGGLYRVGSLVGLAVVLLVVSLIYQRFLSSGVLKEKNAETCDPLGA